MRILRKASDVPKRSLWQRIKDVALMDVAVIARGGVSAGSLEQLEQMLLEARLRRARHAAARRGSRAARASAGW